MSTIAIEGLENVDDATTIYLHDNVTGLFHDLTNAVYTFSIPAGVYDGRYSLRFTASTLGVTTNVISDGIQVIYNNNDKNLHIRNNTLSGIVNSVVIFNMLGQPVRNFTIENGTQSNLSIPVSGISAAAYIVKVTTSVGTVTSKFVVK